MMTYEATQNEFLSALVNRIGRVIITSKSYTNPLRVFKKGILEYGETIEKFLLISPKQSSLTLALLKKKFSREKFPM